MLSFGSIHWGSAFYILSSLGSIHWGLAFYVVSSLGSIPRGLARNSTVVSKRHGREGRQSLLFGRAYKCAGKQVAEERVVYCFGGLLAKLANIVLQKSWLRKNKFNSSVLAGKEPGKMPELYVEVLLEVHGLSKSPQAEMWSKSKCVRKLLPTSPKSASELRWELELPEDVEM